MFDHIAKLSGSRFPVVFTLIAFLLVSVFLSATAPELSSVTTNEESEFLPKNSESLKVLESLQENFVMGAGIPAIVVIASENVLSTAEMARVTGYAERLRNENRPSALGQVLSPTDNPMFMNSMRSSNLKYFFILNSIFF